MSLHLRDDRCARPVPARRPAWTSRSLRFAAGTTLVAGSSAQSLTAQTPAASPAAPPVAAAPTAPAGRRPLDLSVALRGGTLGYGLEVGKLVASRLGVRAAAYTFAYARRQSFSDVQYHARVTLRHASALVDLFPGRRGKFHLTGGLVTGTSEITGRGVPEGETFYLNGEPYTSDEVGTLTSAVRFPRVRPYGGLGWGTPAKNGGGLGFSTDVGVVYGRPTAVFAASNATPNGRLRADLDAERVDAQIQLDRYATLYPVLNWGLTYRF